MKVRITVPYKRYLLPGVVIIIVIASLFWVTRGRSLPEGLLQVNGRLEGDRITISTEYVGRVYKLEAAEGDKIEQNQVVARLDSDRWRTQLSQAENALAALEKQLRAAETSLTIRIQEMPLAIERAEAGLAHALAVLDQTKASEQKALRDGERARGLRPKGAVSEDHLEQVELKLTTARESVAIARAAVAQAQLSLASTKLEPERIRAQEANVEALRAERNKAQSAVDEIRCVIDKLTIRAPASGTVVTRLADLGETLAAGASLFDMVNLERLYLKAFLPEPHIGKIRLGLKAQVFTDAFPDRPFAATVGYIASRAQFTPKEVQTSDDRVKQVFAVKLYLTENPDRCLSPGMPADAMIRWKEEVPWQLPSK